MVLDKYNNNKRRDTFSKRGGSKKHYGHENSRADGEGADKSEEVQREELTMSNLEIQLKPHKTEPQPKEEALANLERLKEQIGMKGIRSNREDVKKILERAGSLADELINLKKQE